MLAVLCMGAAAAPAASDAITDPVTIWQLPNEQKAKPNRIRLEGRVSFYDASYRLFWLETNHVGNYILLGANPPQLRIGQFVRIEGTIVPNEGLSADRVTVTVLRENEPITPLETRGKIGDIVAYNCRVVTADAYVDEQQLIDAEHARMVLVIEDRPVICWFRPDNPFTLPNLVGSFVRVTGLYSGRFDPTGTQTTIEFWLAGQRDLVVLGTINNSPQFEIPATPINQIYLAPPGKVVRVVGQLEAHERGASLVLRDATGEIVVHSVQRQRYTTGTEIEAVGRVAITGSRWVLDAGLCRRAHPAPSGGAAPGGSGNVLESAEQIRQISGEEAARGLPVRMSGMVTWSMPESDFFFLQDLTGGVRVHFARDKMPAPQWLKYLRIEGVTTRGTFAPVVELQRFTDLGSLSHPAAKPITYEQAVTGKEDAQWVEMRGFIQRTESDHDWRWIYVTTSAGEFVGHLQSPVNFVANPGSIIRVKGVCEAVADQDGRVTGVTLRVPFIHDISIDEDAPADPYDLPVREIKSLRQLNSGRDLIRVRIAGTVVQATPGRFAVVQSDDAAVVLLTRETAPLAPGDSIEAVGILGSEGVHTVLREVAYRKTGSGVPPPPLELVDLTRPSLALDARLVRVRAQLIDALRLPERLRLTLQSEGILFEAVLDDPPATGIPEGITPTAGLELTGIYKVSFDDTRQTRGFTIQLRSPADIAVFQSARFLTAGRALTVVAVLCGLSLAAMAWIAALRRRVGKQTKQLRDQMERQARLEAEVQHAARLESLGVLAGGIAHDFNNLLTIMMGNLGLAMLDERVVKAAEPLLREIERGALRARDLTQQLLTFAKGGDPLRSPVVLSDLVRESAADVARGPGVRLDCEFAPDLWPAMADKGQLAQVVQQLVLNSIQAMPHGGVIRLSLRNEEAVPGSPDSLPPGRYVRFAIADTGEGIKPDVLPRIFDPYFTTREKANGLGLATVYSIIRRHEGRIKVESTPGQGATFTIWVPATERILPEPAAPAEPAAAATKSLRRARVLLMDDEESICTLGAALLEHIGLDAVAVRDGSDAIREFSAARDAGRPFDLLILDLTVPGGMGGKETIAAIRKLDPRVPAIVSSGYSNASVLTDFLSCGFQATVPKPYDIDELSRTVKRLLPGA